MVFLWYLERQTDLWSSRWQKCRIREELGRFKPYRNIFCVYLTGLEISLHLICIPKECQSFIHSLIHSLFNYRAFVIVWSSCKKSYSLPIICKFTTEQAAKKGRMAFGDKGVRWVNGHNQENGGENVTLFEVVNQGWGVTQVGRFGQITPLFTSV